MNLRVTAELARKVAFVSALVAVLSVCLVLIFAQRGQPGTQNRPRRATDPQTSSLVVRSGGNLQAIINRAKPGDTITLEAGGVYAGPILLPHKAGDNAANSYITIQTAEFGGIAAPGERIKPEVHARSMAKIMAPENGVAIATEAGAHHYKFIGIEFAPTPTSKYVYNLIDLGSAEFRTTAQLPHHLIFDRCYVHARGLNTARRGFALNSGLTTICNSYISGFAGAGDETQAIAGWNGAGPFNIFNNYLEGGGQGLMFGGGDPAIPNLVPADIQIRGNTFFKPAEWFGKATIKASIELKSAKRILIDGNVIDSGGPVGAFVLTVRNQDGGAPWSTIEDLEITNNIVRNAGGGFTILGRDDIHMSSEAKRIRIANNLMTAIGPDHTAMFLKINGAESVIIENNTIQHTGNMITSYGTPTRRFVFRNNIIQYNSYGIYCELGQLIACFPNGVLTGNIIADNTDLRGQGVSIGQNYPKGNSFPSGFERLGFVDYTRGDWQLLPNSPIKRKATDGGDPGVRFDQLESAQNNKSSCRE